MKYEFKEYEDEKLIDKVLKFNNIDNHTKTLLMKDELDHQLSSKKLDDVVNALLEAKEKNQKVFICGDYDCDGVCATTIMARCLQKSDIEYGYYIPNRISEGYGVNLDRVKQAREKGYDLLLTVDNGVKSKKELSLAKQLGMKVILTDHHSFEQEDIVADHFLHPSMFDEYYQNLCGAALALQISEAMIGEDYFNRVLAMIATIGDVMVLTNYNRYLVKNGLDILNNKRYSKIVKLANLNQFTSEDIAFQIVPKFNAIGRLNQRFCPNNLVRYLMSEDEEFIAAASKVIIKINDQRKQMSNQMFAKSCSLVSNDDFIIVSDESFNEGLNGIVAGKLCEKYQKPVMVLSENDNLYKGSIRSNSVDLTNFFEDIYDELNAYGGHKQASGISFEKEKLPLIKQYCNENIDGNIECEKQEVLLIKKEELNIENVESLKMLEPYGQGVEKPLVAVDLVVDKGFKIANGKHLKLFSEDIELMKFNDLVNMPKDFYNRVCRFIGKIKINEFKNKKVINMIVDDVLK